MAPPLAHYRELWWHPDGTLAVGDRLLIFNRLTNTLVPLFADVGGVTPVPNPVTIGPGGVLDFYADAGDYWFYAPGFNSRYVLELDPDVDVIWPVTYRHTQAAPSSVWSITHGLESEPAVQVVLAGEIVESEVTYQSQDALTITFSAPQTGRAYLRR
jgi:hypothetical protein